MFRYKIEAGTETVILNSILFLTIVSMKEKKGLSEGYVTYSLQSSLLFYNHNRLMSFMEKNSWIR